MMSDAYIPTIGEIIKVGPWNGVVVDRFESAATGGLVLKIHFAKNAFKQQPPELHEMNALGMMGAGLLPSTQVDFDREVAQYQQAISARLAEIKSQTGVSEPFARQVVEFIEENRPALESLARK